MNNASTNIELWNNASPSPCQKIELLGVPVWVKRDDLNHPVVQGNKLRKLKYNFKQAHKIGAKTMVTFGGAYSNHLLATAYAAKACGFDAVGFVRGDELKSQSNKWSETLNQCHRYGMRLVFVSRSDYREKEQAKHIAQTIKKLDAPYVIPEGGSNELALQGVVEIMAELRAQITPPSHIFCPLGTGGTFAGLVRGVYAQKWQCQVFGVAVLKGLQQEKQQIKQWLKGIENSKKHQILEQFDGGGYAKNTEELIGFAIAFEQKTGIALDKIYNTKSFYALAQMIKSGTITDNDQPLIILTGGIQGGVNSPKDLK